VMKVTESAAPRWSATRKPVLNLADPGGRGGGVGGWGGQPAATSSGAEAGYTEDRPGGPDRFGADTYRAAGVKGQKGSAALDVAPMTPPDLRGEDAAIAIAETVAGRSRSCRPSGTERVVARARARPVSGRTGWPS